MPEPPDRCASSLSICILAQVEQGLLCVREAAYLGGVEGLSVGQASAMIAAFTRWK